LWIEGLHGRVLVHRDGPHALLRKAIDLVDGRLLVPGGKDTDGNEAAGIGHAPLVVVPVVPCLHVAQRQRLVGGLVEGLAVEADRVAEAQRGGDAVDVHVVDAGVDVIAAVAQLIERSGLHAVFLERTAGHGIEADRGADMALVFPVVLAARVRAQLRRAREQIARELVVEHIAGFADVIVGGDHHHIVHFHRADPLSHNLQIVPAL
jgi:hypothetical protein